MRKYTKRRLIQGVGVNDVDYPVTVYEGGKQVWICPYYSTWRSMLKRSHSAKFKARNKHYEHCTSCDEWKCLTKFIEWVDSQPNRNWQQCHLDKDLLGCGKMYSPDTCSFVSPLLNLFLTDSKSARGSLPIGVGFDKRGVLKPYFAYCSNPFTPKTATNHVGMYSTIMEAHKAWQAKKHEYACQLADLQVDSRVARALRERYAPDKDWTNR